jgi:hypothetical protein
VKQIPPALPVIAGALADMVEPGEALLPSEWVRRNMPDKKSIFL